MKTKAVLERLSGAVLRLAKEVALLRDEVEELRGDRDAIQTPITSVLPVDRQFMHPDPGDERYARPQVDPRFKTLYGDLDNLEEVELEDDQDDDEEGGIE